MALLDILEILYVKFDGNKYFLWEFPFRLFVQGEDMRGYVDGFIPKLTDIENRSTGYC